jgi:hypothetical protein
VRGRSQRVSSARRRAAARSLSAYYETTIADQYDVPGLGNACEIVTDTTYSYDNAQSGKLQSTDKDVETIVLTSETGPKPLLATAGGAPVTLFIELPSQHRRKHLGALLMPAAAKASR